MITTKQIQLIHIAKAQLHIDDDLYRDILADRYVVWVAEIARTIRTLCTHNKYLLGLFMVSDW